MRSRYCTLLNVPYQFNFLNSLFPLQSSTIFCFLVYPVILSRLSHIPFPHALFMCLRLLSVSNPCQRGSSLSNLARAQHSINRQGTRAIYNYLRPPPPLFSHDFCFLPLVVSASLDSFLRLLTFVAPLATFIVRLRCKDIDVDSQEERAIRSIPGV